MNGSEIMTVNMLGGRQLMTYATDVPTSYFAYQFYPIIIVIFKVS